MTKLEKFKKLYKFISANRHGARFCHGYSSNFTVKNNKVYYATWDVDPHNGDHEDYKERPAKNEDVSDFLIRELESEVIEILEEKKKENLLKEFYLND